MPETNTPLPGKTPTVDTARGSTSSVGRPLRHAYEITADLTVRPGMIARCGHVRTGAEGETGGDLGRKQLDPCMVCLEIDNAIGGWAR